MKKILENKKLMAGCIAGIVAIAVLVLVIVLAAGGNSGNGGSTGTNSSVPGVTDGTQKPSIDPTDTLPDESTGVTDPTESTGSADETDPTETVEPTDPTETTPPETEPVTEPSTEPETEPEDTWIPTEDPNAKPTEGETFDFGNVTPSTLTYEEWSSWSKDKRNAFCSGSGYKGGMSNWTVEEKHDYYCLENNNYDCGYEGHWCTNAMDHGNAMAQINKGCEHCGKHDCPSLTSYDMHGGWKYDHTLCPEYDVKKDPNAYCEYCGLPQWHVAKVGEECCSRGIFSDFECTDCGGTIYVDKCHHCVRKS